jgi:hypothetical protein
MTMASVPGGIALYTDGGYASGGGSRSIGKIIHHAAR